MTDEDIDEEKVGAGVAIIGAIQGALEALTDNAVTFVIIGTVMYMIATGVPIPPWVQAIVVMIASFYYKAK